MTFQGAVMADKQIRRDFASYLELKRGDVIQLDYGQSIIGDGLDGIDWYIFKTAPQAELAAIAWLARNGVDDAWCPTETRYRNVPRGKVKKVPYEAPIAPGYLFVPFKRQPIWHVLFERSKRKLTHVVSDNGIPLVIPEKSIAQMQYVPKRIEEIRKRDADARRLAPGDRADVRGGVYDGRTVELTRIHGGIAYFVAKFLGEREIAISVDRLSKVMS